MESEDPAMRSRGRCYPPIIKWYQGKFREALEALETAIAADKADGYHAEQHWQKFTMRSGIYTDLGQYDRAIIEAQIRLDILKQLFPEYSAQIDLGLAVVYAYNNDLEHAENVIGAFGTGVDSLSQEAQSLYYQTKVKIALETGDPESTVAYWEQTQDKIRYFLTAKHDVATAYMESNKTD